MKNFNAWYSKVGLCRDVELKMALTLPLRKGLYLISRKEGERLNAINRRVFKNLRGNTENTAIL